MDNKKIGVIGAGSWGTALAITLARKGHEVNIWSINSAHIEDMISKGENEKYLPNIKFPDTLKPVKTTEEAVLGADAVLFAAPAQQFRNALEKASPYLNDSTVIINAAKGIEQKTLKRMSEIAFEHNENMKYVMLSGPSHAEEVGQNLPTTVVSAALDTEIAEFVQDLFMTERFRVYTSEDLIGVELGGALKNIIALGAGISDGMGYGDNAKAALMTRGMVEISRLGVKLGADVHTFTGLTGIGDLIVTCTSMHSRNRRCGIMIGEGMKPQEATKKIGMVVEGMFTAEAAYELAKREGIDMPITQGIYAVIKEKIDPKEAVNALMTRDRKREAVY